MVDVCRVIEGLTINIDGLVPIPISWIICHCNLSNLRIMSDINVMLDSPRVSERIVGEILIAYDNDSLGALDKYSWVFYNTKRKGVEGILIPEKGKMSTLTFNSTRGERKFPVAPMILRDGEVYYGFKTAIQEREYNEVIQRYFCKGLGVKIVNLSPLLGSISLRSVSAYEEPKRARVDKDGIRTLHDQLERREAWRKQHNEES